MLQRRFLGGLLLGSFVVVSYHLKLSFVVVSYHLKLSKHTPEASSSYAALKTPSKDTSFQAFDKTSKDIWCGGAGYADNCQLCPTDFGEVPRAGCAGNCHWCEYGAADSRTSEQGQCELLSLACPERDFEQIVKDLSRVYEPYKGDPLEFCVEDDGDKENVRGILLAKTFKTASTTAAAVSTHMAERAARRKNLTSLRCKHFVHHKFSRGNLPKLRKDPSVLWTSVREPGSRGLSAYYFYRVGRKEVNATDTTTIKFLNNIKNHQFIQLRTQRTYSADGGSQTRDQILEDSNQMYARILREEIMPLYDFIAVTERMEESLVVLKLLWGLEHGDIIVSAAKAGEWSYNWYPKGTCFKIPKSQRTDAVMNYMKTDFRKENGDFLLHAIANRSLEMTIESLGRDRFNQELQKHRQLKAFTMKHCQNNATFPCSTSGEWQEGFQESCYDYDVGCGYRCIDDALDRYESGELI
jgi:hypothetical protein